MNAHHHTTREHRTHRTGLSALFCAAAAWNAGCAYLETEEGPRRGDLEIEEAPAAAAGGEETQAAPFHTVQLGDGRRVELFDLGDGDIGIGEVRPTGAASIVGALLGERGATPLEVYLALGGDVDHPPRVLVEAHAAQVTREGRATASPRKMPGVQALVPTGLSSYPAGKCGTWLGTSWYWEEDWYNTYESSRDVMAATVLLDEDVWPGKAFYAGGKKVTAANMGVCVDDNWINEYNSASDKVTFRVFAKSSGTASGCGSSTWGSAIYTVVVNEDQSANFYTSSFAGKLVCATVTAYNSGASFTETRDYGIATAYDPVLVLSP